MATFKKSKGLGAPPTMEEASPNLSAPEAAPAASELPPAPPFVAHEPREPASTDEAAQQPVFPRRKEPTQTMNLRVPLSLFTELREFMRKSEIPMTEVMVEGARKELAALKKKYGIDKK
jgi:hypothetical protein